MMGRRTLVAAIIAIILAHGPQPTAFAGTTRGIESASAQEVVDGMANKFARGVANTATGWLEFPKQISMTWREEGPARGMLVGPLKGVGMTIARTVSGAGEAMTFFIAWPGFFDPYIDPPYVWEKK